MIIFSRMEISCKLSRDFPDEPITTVLRTER